MRGGRVVERFDIEPQRVAGQKTAVLGIEPSLDDRTIPDPADVERLAYRLPDAAGAAHPPAHHGKPCDAVIVPHIGDELLTQRNRQRRVTGRDRQRDDGRGIGNDQEVQLRGDALERGPVGAQRPQPPGAARGGREATVDARPRDAQLLKARLERPGSARERHTRGPVRQDGGTGGQRNHVRAHQQRLIGAAQV